MLSDDANQRLPLFVINLDRDKVRLANIAAALGRIGRPYERVRGIDGKNRFSLLQRLIRNPMYSPRAHRSLTHGEVGCLLSHISALKRIIRRRLPIAVILEDDAEWDERFRRFLAVDLANFMQRCDVLKFEGLRASTRNGWGVTLRRGETTRLVMPLAPSVGMAGYAVTLEGARLLAASLARLDEPADFVVARYERYGIVLGETRPFLARQAAYPTNIESVRWGKPSVRAPLVHRIHNRIDGVVKRWLLITRTICRQWRSTRGPTH